MAAGDHIKVWCDLYWHHGIDMGDDTVIHYSGKVNSIFESTGGRIEHVPAERFHGGREVHVVPHPYRLFDAEQTIARARQRLGETRYGFDANNCEHFVSWAIEGLHESGQVDAVATGAAAGIAALVGGLGTGAVISAGRRMATSTVQRALAGLVRVGPGGVLGGLATMTIASGLAATAITSATVLRPDPAFDDTEAMARSVGRVASVAGAAGGAAASLATVGAVGTVPGLSGAGIVTGLHAIGAAATFGVGGFTTGLGIALAVPAATAAATGLSAAAIIRRALGRWQPSIRVVLPSWVRP